jgi:hypothetical protein
LPVSKWTNSFTFIISFSWLLLNFTKLSWMLVVV